MEDYRINIAEQGSAFSVLASGLASPSYTATGLTPGVYYEFKVESRNAYDYSTYSETVTLLNAWVPDAPVLSNDPTVTTDTLIKVQWTAPFYGGIVILDY